MLGLSEAEAIHDIIASFTGKSVITPRGTRNILSGKNEPKRKFSETLDRYKVAPEVVEMARTAESEFDESGAPVEPVDLVKVSSFARGMREFGCVYFADVVGDIAEHEKRALAAVGMSRPQPEILKGGLAKIILAREEIKALQDAGDNTAIGQALSPLRLKTPLYALAAFEVDSLHQVGVAPSDLSDRIADGGENAFGAFIDAVIQRTGKTDIDFARKHMPDKKGENSDEDSKVKKLRRWRKGENIPHWRDVLALGRNLGLSEDCAYRALFISMLANYSSMAAKCAKRLDMRLNVGGEYRRFLDIHLAEIKKRGRAK